MRRLRASLLKKKGLSLVTQYLGNCSDCCGMVKGGKLKQKEKKKKRSSLTAQLTPFSIPAAVVLGGTRPQWANFLRRKKEGRTQSVPPCPPVRVAVFFGKFKCSRSLNICSVLMRSNRNRVDLFSWMG